MALDRRVQVAERITIGGVSCWLLGDVDGIRVRVDGPDAAIRVHTTAPGWAQTAQREVVLRPGQHAIIGDCHVSYAGSPDNAGVNVTFSAPRHIPVHVHELGRYTPVVA